MYYAFNDKPSPAVLENKAWIQTATGAAISPLHLRAQDIHFYDLAVGLANTCRYGRQIENFYSVAEHSIILSNIVGAPYAKEALLHDATEAYLGDLPTPLKRIMPEYRRLENKIYKLISYKFGLAATMSDWVKRFDKLMISIEAPAVFKKIRDDWEIIKPTEYNIKVNCYPPQIALANFIDRAKELGIDTEI